MDKYQEELEDMMDRAWETELAHCLEQIADDLLFHRTTYSQALDLIEQIRNKNR